MLSSSTVWLLSVLTRVSTSKIPSVEEMKATWERRLCSIRRLENRPPPLETAPQHADPMGTEPDFDRWINRLLGNQHQFLAFLMGARQRRVK